MLPLRGKILNTGEVDSAQVLGSQEVHDIALAIGVDPGSSDLANLRYHKICIWRTQTLMVCISQLCYVPYL